MELSMSELQFILEALKNGKNSYKEKSHKYVHQIEGYVEMQNKVLNEYRGIINKLQEEKKRLKNESTNCRTS